MKKILVIHNQYRETGGEDIAVKNEIELLKSFYNVETLIFNNNVENYFLQILYFLVNRNFKSEKKLKEKLQNFNPDVVYVHNTWFKASVGILKILEKSNIKTIIKLHNFRYFCTRHWLKTSHIKQKIYCEACGFEKDRSFVFNQYFKESKIKSIFMIIYGKAYFNYLKSGKFKIVVLTKFHQTFLYNLGFSRETISVQRNYQPYNNNQEKSPDSNTLLYAGRISKDKGVEELILSFLKVKDSSLILKIAGDGPDYLNLKNKYVNPRIEFLGWLNNKKVIELILESRAVITATKLYEGQPTILSEASMLGVPSIFPNFGGMSEFFEPDYPLKFKQFEYNDLVKKIELIQIDDNLDNLGKQNQEFVKRLLNSEKILNDFCELINE